MSIKPTDSCWIFVIKTNTYAGNFERQMCGFITGQVGECGVGGEEAELFRKEHPNYTEFYDLVIDFPDEHGCHRPASVWNASCNDVAIFMENSPMADQLAFMRDRARKFAGVTNPQDGEYKKITILGFELVRYKIECHEMCFERWRKGG